MSSSSPSTSLMLLIILKEPQQSSGLISLQKPLLGPLVGAGDTCGHADPILKGCSDVTVGIDRYLVGLIIW